MMFFKTGANFLIFLSAILIYGFGLTAYAISNQIFNEGQYAFILSHLALTLSLLLTWLVVHDVKALMQKNKTMQDRLMQLEKYDQQTKALSFQEFKERGLLIETGMRRRGETGQLLYFKMSKDVPLPVRSSLRHTFINICLSTVRSEFDLVTSPTEDEVLVLLQGTDQAGRDVVIKRLEEAVKAHVNFVSLPFEVHSYELGSLEAIIDELFDEESA